MPQIIVKIQDKIAKAVNDLLVCGNSDYTIKFKFDEEWSNETVKTARFVWNNQYVDVVFTDDICEVPVIVNTEILAVGVFAGDLTTSTPAIIHCSKSILCEDGFPVEPSEDVYTQIMKLINEKLNIDVDGKIAEHTIEAQAMWKADIAEAVGIAENELKKVVSLPVSQEEVSE